MYFIIAKMVSVLKALYLLVGLQATSGFQNFDFPRLPNFFQKETSTPSRRELELNLLESISNTQYGKAATPSQQRNVLNQIAELESTFPAPPVTEVFSQIDGTWFLQYTSPSELEDGEDDENDSVPSWKNAEENITSKKFKAKGSVSAAGIEVDVSKQPPKQIIDASKKTFFNEVSLEKAFVRVGGPFRLSKNNEKRIVAAFKICEIDLKFIKLDLGFLFKLIALARGTEDSGWLETTYLSDDVRVGRGNRGSMFILTRDEGAVSP